MNRQQPLRRRQPMRPGAPLKRAPLPPGTRTALRKIPEVTCCGKRRFATREAADREIGRLSATGRDRRPVFAYQCGQGWWHLTSQNPVDRIARGAARARARQREKRETGEFSPAVKLLCRTRAGNGDPEQALCESCGIWLGQYGGIVQHRRARMSGGSRDPVIASIVNAALQCGTVYTGCNGLAEGRDDDMNGMGFWLKNGEPPATTPIMLHGAGGGGVTVWLTPEGSYSTTPPEAAA